jgi:6-pyruvoyltetrahydropterin/6-carboxytetrahydropterin synthase
VYRISKRFRFEASHILDHLPADHPCNHLHGHSYRVEVILVGASLDERGFVVDYRDLDRFKTYLDTTLDHKHLNDVMPLAPTAENIARWLYDWAKVFWPQIAAIRVSETEKTWAEYTE